MKTPKHAWTLRQMKRRLFGAQRRTDEGRDAHLGRTRHGRGKIAIIAITMAVLVSALTGLAGASVASANGVPFAKGDVLADIGGGIIKHFNASGTLLDELNTTTGTNEGDGMCFDAAGNLYATQGFIANTMSKFDANGNLLMANFGSGFNEHPESCVFNAANEMYVGQPDGSKEVLKFTTSGELLESFAPETESRGTDWLDLAGDQCTLDYTSEGSEIKRYNVCTHTQLTPFATGLPAPCYAHRILPDGSELVACTSVVEHVNAAGEIIQTYAPGGTLLFALNLDPDGETFWTADYFTGTVFRINIASGALVTTFSAAPLNSVLGGLAIVGELTQTPKIELAPPTAENPVGTTHTVTATVTEGGKPAEGVTVTFDVTGANPQTGTGTTDSSGKAAFTYLGKAAGTDHIVASFADKKGETITSNEVTKIWTSSEDPKITVTGQNLSGTEGAEVSGVVAKFTDPDTSATASEYAATIEWGDGSSSAGTVSGSGGSFSVSGSHTYADEGGYAVAVTIVDIDNESNTATASSTASIADAALSAKGVSTTSPMAFSGAVASFTDANAGGSASDFAATIEWGDGSSSAGTVSGSGGSFSVSGSHTYASTGWFEVIVKIVDDGGSTAEAKSRVLVFGTAKGGSFVIGDRKATIGTSVTFWGARWWKLNSLSGGSTPISSFKGFEDNPATVACGTVWKTDPGNSTPPPRGPLPAYMLVIVSSKVAPNGSRVTGNTVHEVVVKTKRGYAPGPGHAGTGKVVAKIC